MPWPWVHLLVAVALACLIHAVTSTQDPQQVEPPPIQNTSNGRWTELGEYL